MVKLYMQGTNRIHSTTVAARLLFIYLFINTYDYVQEKAPYMYNFPFSLKTPRSHDESLS